MTVNKKHNLGGVWYIGLNPENIVVERFSVWKVTSCYHHQISSLPPWYQLQFPLALHLALHLDLPKEWAQTILQFVFFFFFFLRSCFYYMERHCKWFSTKSLSSFSNINFSNRFFSWQNDQMFQHYFSFDWFCQQQLYALFQRNIEWAKAMTEGYSMC